MHLKNSAELSIFFWGGGHTLYKAPFMKLLWRFLYCQQGLGCILRFPHSRCHMHIYTDIHLYIDKIHSPAPYPNFNFKPILTWSVKPSLSSPSNRLFELWATTRICANFPSVVYILVLNTLVYKNTHANKQTWGYVHRNQPLPADHKVKVCVSVRFGGIC